MGELLIYCEQCGVKNDDGIKFCIGCGYKIVAYANCTKRGLKVRKN